MESSTWDSTKCAQGVYDKMLGRAPEHARSLDKARSGARVCIMQTRLHQLTLRTCVVRKSSREITVKLEAFHDTGFDYVSGEWTGFDIGVGRIFPGSATSELALTLLFIETRISRYVASQGHIRNR